MLKTTIEAVRAVLNTDATMQPADVRKAIDALRNFDKPDTDAAQQADRPIMSAADVARFLGVNKRTVRRLAVAGDIMPLSLPGRKRAFGYDAASVRALLDGKRSA